MPLYLNPKSGRFTTTKLSLGALGDSYYEYLLKMWILKGRSPADEMYRSMWERAMDEMIEKLVFTSIPEGLTYVAEFDRCACLCMSGGGSGYGREGGGAPAGIKHGWWHRPFFQLILASSFTPALGHSTVGNGCPHSP